ncbi:MAG: hypothetical protein IT196_01255 [Acidimicrobiales bacterium]|nr:hypothetical protein [Acidimicrobiales bacterium]
MCVSLFGRWLLALMALASGVGVLDAAIGGQLDLVVLHSTVLSLTIALALHTAGPGRMVPIRGDLARWLDQRAAGAGERPADVANRAIGAYRAGLTGDAEVGREAMGRSR